MGIESLWPARHHQAQKRAENAGGGGTPFDLVTVLERKEATLFEARSDAVPT